QGRYAIRHEWTGPIECKDPVRGVWGGPPAGQTIAEGPVAATDLAFVPRGEIALARMVRRNIPELGVTAAPARPAGQGGGPAAPAVPPYKPKKEKKGCAAGGGAGAGGQALVALGVLLGLGSLRRRPRRRAGGGAGAGGQALVALGVLLGLGSLRRRPRRRAGRR